MTLGWLVVLFVLLLGFGLIYAYFDRRLTAVAASKPPFLEEAQCPQCQRWKQMAPIETQTKTAPKEDAATGALHPGQYQTTTRRFRCPFCGHRWGETHESFLGVG